MALYDELIWRNMIKDVSNEKEAEKLLNEDKIKFYCGFDPTGNSLTVGHLVQIVRMMLLQKHGHIPVVLVGGATGLIGDPKDTQERKLLTLEQSLHNARGIKDQLSRFLQGKAEFVNNYDWLSKIDLIAFLRDYGKHFNINYMLAKDTVAKRLEIGISFTEFSYMILQSIDFHHLYKHHQVKLQFGGSDQWGNITAGLELIRKLEGDNDAIGMSSPLLLKADGTKFGKSESGALWIDRKLTSPYELYQYFFNAADNDVLNYLKSLTLLSKTEIETIYEASLKHPELRVAQKRLAEEVVVLVHGKEALDEALSVTKALFTGSFDHLTAEAFESLLNTLPSQKIQENSNIIEVLVSSELASSNREARQFVESGAVTINGSKVSDTTYLLSSITLYHHKYAVLKRGKKKYAILIGV